MRISCVLAVERARHSPSRPLNTSTGRALRQPQHIAEIIRLHAVERRRSARSKRRIDEQPRRAEIVGRHGYSSHLARPVI